MPITRRGRCSTPSRRAATPSIYGTELRYARKGIYENSQWVNRGAYAVMVLALVGFLIGRPAYLVAMPMRVEVYRGFQLVVVEQPNGSYCVEIMPTGGTDLPVLTQDHRDASAALSLARLMVDRRVAGRCERYDTVTDLRAEREDFR
jgi:hypothetical protein